MFEVKKGVDLQAINSMKKSRFFAEREPSKLPESFLVADADVADVTFLNKTKALFI